MNIPVSMPFDIDHEATKNANSGTALATLANIKDLTDGRDAAISLWMEMYDDLHAKKDLAGKICIGGSIGLPVPIDGRYSGDNITKAFLTTGSDYHYDRKTGKRVEIPAREAFRAEITKEIDRRCWKHLMTQLGFDSLLDRVAREEFYASLRDSPSEFTPENCAATFSTLWGNRREMYLRGIANAFMHLDRRFRSHDAFGIGNRMIIENAVSEWGSWNSHNRSSTMYDVERIFRELDGMPPISQGLGIVDAISKARRHEKTPCVVENEHFRVRVFANGNLHIWFTRKDLLEKVNELLLEYYKPVEGDVGEGPSYESGPLYHKTPAKNYGAFNSSEDVAKRVIEFAGIVNGERVLEPSAGTGVLARAAREAGGIVTCVEIQPGLAHELQTVHGFETICKDFLEVDHFDFENFDCIIMNPPFDRGRDCDHVRAAYAFLKPGGRLVAVMSARAEHAKDARHKALHDLIARTQPKYRSHWFDLPEKSFAHAGTNVNTVILRLEKPR